MDIKLRRHIAKYKYLHKLMRIIAYNSGIFFYKRLYYKEKYKYIFKTLKSSKNGHRCFIIGNGPSLSIADLNLLINEDCFASNKIYRVFETTSWRPTFFLIMDRYFNGTAELLRDIKCDIVFLGDYYWRFNKVLRKDAVCLHEHVNFRAGRYKCSEDISKYLDTGPTVSYAAMQIAAYMGYSEIYLLGFDHDYEFIFSNNGNVEQTKTEKSHFYEDDMPESIIADVKGMTKAYEAFSEYAYENGIIIKNATRGGKLEVFERVDFDSLFG